MDPFKFQFNLFCPQILDLGAYFVSSSFELPPALIFPSTAAAEVIIDGHNKRVEWTLRLQHSFTPFGEAAAAAKAAAAFVWRSVADGALDGVLLRNH